MNVKTFRAPTVQQALQQVKADLGDDAMIIHSYRTRADGIAGMLGRHWVEVAAAKDDPAAPHAGRPATAESRLGRAPVLAAAERRAGRLALAAEQRLGRAGLPGGVDPAGGPVGSLGDLRELRALLIEFRQALDRVQTYPQPGRRKPPTRAVAELAQQLRNQGLSTEAIDQVIEALERELGPTALADSTTVRRAVQSVVAGWVGAVPARLSPIGPEVPPGGSRVLFLVGPTGVGKTTTIAKLAALAAVGTRRRVTLITMDNHRIGAIDQLQKFATLLRLPLRRASTPPELLEQIAAAPDLVLVDTHGCSQYDDVHLAELRDYLGVAPGSTVYLVANAGASAKALADTADRFAPFDGVIVSKVDEAPGIGPAVDLVRGCRKPVAFVTTGSMVPDDIEPGSADGLLRRLLES